MMRTSAVRVGLVFPELLGTYGDRGNAVVLVERCRRRGIEADLIEVSAGSPIPVDLDIYLFGGGEDDAQVMAATGMRESGAAIASARSGGSVVFAVCAGFQLLGTTYEANDGEILDGLGLVDLATRAGDGRCIGECVVVPDAATGLPTLTGFENHGGRTTLGPGIAPLGRVTTGFGNGIDGCDGVLADHLLGTYLHGPVLPRNPALADHLLGWIVGPDALTPLDDHLVDALRAERLREAQLTGLAARRRDWHLNRG
ncbi:MAG: glutamine amidotransferase [Acidimicrobiia bacterium]|nr:glutamine amidotransferase [Acidimicrobiia bacterium]